MLELHTLLFVVMTAFLLMTFLSSIKLQHHLKNVHASSLQPLGLFCIGYKNGLNSTRILKPSFSTSHVNNYIKYKSLFQQLPYF